MRTPLISFSATSILLAAGGQASAQHAGDIGLGLSDGRIATGTYENGTFLPGRRVFGTEFGELVANFTDEPGFDSGPGAFPVPSTITFNVLAALRAWNGTTFGNDIPTDRISIGFGPLTPVLTPTTDTLTPGFALAVAGNGEWHRHLAFTLTGDATDGIYLLQLNLSGSTPGMQTSLPFFIVFNQNMPEHQHDAAIEWTEANLVPTTGSLPLLLSAACLTARRRRTA